jgi:hypothetical protein
MNNLSAGVETLPASFASSQLHLGAGRSLRLATIAAQIEAVEFEILLKREPANQRLFCSHSAKRKGRFK